MKKNRYQSTFARLLLAAGLFLGTNWAAYAAVPTVSSISVTSTPTAGGGTYYESGETLTFMVQLSEPVTVTGVPSIKFMAAGSTFTADYTGGTTTDTLTFEYDLTTGVNDWNGITVTQFSPFTILNDVLSVSTIERPVEDFVDEDINILIDTDIPAFSALNSNNGTTGVLDGTTRYFKAGDTLSFDVVLTGNDTRSNTGYIEYSIGTDNGLQDNFNTATAGTTSVATVTTAGAFLDGRNGQVTVTDINLIDQAGKTMTGDPSPVSTFGGETFIVDTTLPSFSFTDDTSANAVTSDDIAVTITDTYLDTATLAYGLSIDATCDAGDTYGTAYTSGDTITINTETYNGQYLCFTATDKAGNTAYQRTTNPINIDITAPVFSTIGVTSDNAVDPNYAKNDSTLTFTLTLAAADSFNGGGATTGRVEFTIGGVARTADFVDSASYTTAGSYTASYPLAGENGTIEITDIIFEDRVGNGMTGFVGTQIPTPTVAVDTTAPSLTSATVSTTGNTGWAKANEQVTYTLNFSEDIQRQTLNSATTANNASTLVQEFDISSFGTSDQIIVEVESGDNGNITINNVDITLRDRAGNTTTLTGALINAAVAVPIQADTTKPTVSSISIASNNANDTTLAKTHDTIRVSFTTADNLSPTVSLRGNSHILNKTVTATSIGAVGASWMERFTDGTETSEVVVPFLIKIEDEAGNISNNYTSITAGTNVQFDRTNPLVSSVTISATSADNSAYTGDAPTYYAKQGDTLDLSFQTCDYVDTVTTPAPSGTLFGQAVTMTNDGLGAACTTPEGNTANYRRWRTQLTNVDGTEGSVTFSLNVYDEAGNGVVTVTGTTDGSNVVFDKTRPQLPTQVLDSVGAETTTFKHRSKAQFTWAGASDPNLSGADQVASVWKYKLRLTNSTNGGEDHRGTSAHPEETTGTTFDGRTSNMPDPGQTEIPARAETNPYEFRLIVVDKAGNHSHGNQTNLDWSHDPVYEQPYTIGIEGRVTNLDGEPLRGVVVQVVPRYGEVCDTNQNICTAVTDANGFYSRVIKKQQDYTVNYFQPGFYLYKADESIALDDLTVNLSLTGIVNNLVEQQTGSQTVFITTDARFVDEYDITRRTEMYVAVYSGQVTTYNDFTYNGKRGIKITSVSEIFSITVNNPHVEIINMGNNEYLVLNAGDVETNSGALTEYTANPLKQSIQIPTTVGNSGRYSGGGRRSDYGAGVVWTRAEVEADNARLNNGWEGKVNFYTNENGYEIFAGYTNGKVAMERMYNPRNIPIATNIASSLQKEDQIRNNPKPDQKLMMQTDRTRATVGDTIAVRNQFRASTQPSDESHYRAVTNRYELEQTKINKFERKRASVATPSRLQQLTDSNPKYRLFPGMPTISLRHIRD